MEPSAEDFFTPPPNNGLTLPEIYDFHLLNSSRHPVFRYTPEHGKATNLTWLSVGNAVRHGSVIARRNASSSGRSFQGSHVIAILANAGSSGFSLDAFKCCLIVSIIDPISYLILVASLMRCGQIPFPISPRCSSAALHHLLRATNASYVYVSQDEATQNLLSVTISEFCIDDLSMFLMPKFEDFFQSPPSIRGETDRLQKSDLDAPALILHSSGTTTFPRPVYISHRIVIQRGCLESDSGISFHDHIISLHSIPMFHAFGLTYISRIAMTGIVLAVVPPVAQTRPINPRTVLAASVADQCTLMACVPSVLEEWAAEPEHLEILQRFYAVIVSGGPLSVDTGDRLASAGVKLSLYYAGTEIGCATTYLPDRRNSQDWQYVKFMPQFGAHLIPQDEPDTFELVAVDVPNHRIAAVNSTVDGRNAYITGDLFKGHPSDPSLWKVWGRADDQIVLSNGEKTNPVPIENVFTQHPSISKAIVFGHGRSHNGILLQLSNEHVFSPTNAKALETFRKSITSTVTSANKIASTHSRIFLEMILVAHPEKPFVLTAKGNVRRAQTLLEYSDEIEEAYSNLVGYDGSSKGTMLEVIREIIEDVMEHTVVLDRDLFQQGCDSLQATRIRNLLQHMLSKRYSIGRPALPRDILYEFSSLASLANYLSNLVSDASLEFDSRSNEVEAMLKWVQESTFEPTTHTSDVSVTQQKSKNAVLITGTTGSLGCHLLYTLANDPEYSHIYAVNRIHSNAMTLLQRQTRILEENGLDPSVLSSGGITLIEQDLSSQSWDIDKELYDEMSASVSVVLHAAWTVDFKLKLSSFSDCFLGLRRLIDFSLCGAESRHLVFISTLAVMRNWPKGGKFREESILDAYSAAGLGYSESKWVAEHILELAASAARLKVTIIRAGQLSGADNGCWKVTEWFPTLVRSSRLIGCLPSIDERVSWVPVSAAARIISDVLQTDKPLRYFHLVHPYRVHLMNLLSPIASYFSIPIVSFNEWLEKLRGLLVNDPTSGVSETTSYVPSDLRVLSLLDYFSVKNSSDDFEKWQDSDIDITQMKLHSPTMSSEQLLPLGCEDAHRWMAYWMSVGLL
ncbi:hypothetical protein H2248_007864 [Termitomyces sp. 'cryptogamus']|nr:hypothetical protein H2248_007864 [Termitomyces sp. 'cryptogamus']